MMNARKVIAMGAYCLVVWAVVFAASLRSRAGVAQGTTTGNAALLANVSLGFVGADSRVQHPFTRVSICADELVLIPEDPSADIVALALEGSVGVMSAGPFVDFGNFRIPPGTYRELRIHVGGCEDAATVVQNDQGTFTSSNGFALAWRQRIEVGARYQRIWLPVDSVLRAAQTLDGTRELVVDLERRTPRDGGPRVILLHNRG